MVGSVGSSAEDSVVGPVVVSLGPGRSLSTWATVNLTEAPKIVNNTTRKKMDLIFWSRQYCTLLRWEDE